MKCGSLIFKDHGEGEVSFSPGFMASDWVLKADALSDWIAELEAAYQSILGHSDKSPKETADMISKAIKATRGDEG